MTVGGSLDGDARRPRRTGPNRVPANDIGLHAHLTTQLIGSPIGHSRPLANSRSAMPTDINPVSRSPRDRRCQRLAAQPQPRRDCGRSGGRSEARRILRDAARDFNASGETDLERDSCERQTQRQGAGAEPRGPLHLGGKARDDLSAVAGVTGAARSSVEPTGGPCPLIKHDGACRPGRPPAS